MPITTTVRSTPLGKFLQDGQGIKIACSGDPDISFWEKTIQPSGKDGGDAIDVSHMHLTKKRRIKAPRVLAEDTDITGTASFDPNVEDQINAQLNVNQEWTLKHPNGDTVDFWGWLAKWELGEYSSGEQPEANFTIIVSNMDGSQAEQIPNYKKASGTDTVP